MLVRWLLPSPKAFDQVVSSVEQSCTQVHFGSGRLGNLKNDALSSTDCATETLDEFQEAEGSDLAEGCVFPQREPGAPAMSSFSELEPVFASRCLKVGLKLKEQGITTLAKVAFLLLLHAWVWR